MSLYQVLCSGLCTVTLATLVACGPHIHDADHESGSASAASKASLSVVEKKLVGEVCTSAVEQSSATVACPSGQTITQIVFASYGTPTGTCGAYAASACNASSSMSIANAQCLGKSSCTISADNGVFGDPCPGADKSLVLDVVCNGGTSATPTPRPTVTPTPTATPKPTVTPTPVAGGSNVCGVATEHSNLNLACPSGRRISQVTFASYGTATGTCGAYKLGSCNASNSMSVLQAACVGKTSCVVASDNNAFGDPCSGTQKSLTVQVICAISTATPTPTPTATPVPVTPTPTPSSSNVISMNDANIFVTPENWVRNGAASIETNNPGAYFKMGFTGTSFRMVVDTSSNPPELPKIGYSIDGAAVKYLTLSAASSNLSVTLATGLASGNHQIKVSLEGLGYNDRWNTPVDRLKITSVVLDTGAHAIAPTLKPKRMIAYGDSITEGANTLGNTNFVANKQWSTAWDARVADGLNAEVSVIAFQGQGYAQEGQGNVPDFRSAYNFVRHGVPRTFTKPDYIFVIHGANGIVTQPDVALMIQRIRAAYSTGQLYVGVPFAGYNRDTIRNAFNQQSYTNTSLLDLGSAGESVIAGNTTDGGHPTPEGYRQIADLILKMIPH